MIFNLFYFNSTEENGAYHIQILFLTKHIINDKYKKLEKKGAKFK